MDLARNLKVECVSRLHLAPPRCVGPTQTVAEALRLMKKERVGYVLVCQADLLVGIFTERDLMRRVIAEGKLLTLPIAECMTVNPVTIHPQTPIGVAVRHMEEGGYRHLPLVDEAGKPVSVLSVKHIVHYLVEHFPGTVYNLPPDPAVVPREPEGA